MTRARGAKSSRPDPVAVASRDPHWDVETLTRPAIFSACSRVSRARAAFWRHRQRRLWRCATLWLSGMVPSNQSRTTFRGRSRMPGRSSPRGSDGRPAFEFSNFESRKRGPGTRDVDPDSWTPKRVRFRRWCLVVGLVFLISRRLAFFFLKTDAGKCGLYVHVM